MKQTLIRTIALGVGLWAIYALIIFNASDAAASGGKTSAVAEAIFGAAFFGSVCALSGLTAISLLYGFWHALRCHLALRRAASNQPLRDGRFEALIGTVVPCGEELLSPLMLKPCVMYQYKAYRPTRGHRRRGSLSGYFGVALAPCAVDSPRGRVSLGGFPLLNGLREDWPDYADLKPLARRYFDEVEFAEVPRSLKEITKVLVMFREDAPQLQHDWSMRGGPLHSRMMFGEYSVAAGSQICVLGRYSAASNTLGHHWAASIFSSTLLQIFAAGPAAARGKIMVRLVATLPPLLLMIAIPHTALISWLSR